MNFETGYDAESHTLFLVGQVDEMMYYRARTAKDVHKVILNTYGGDVCQALAIYHFLKSRRVHIHVVGACMSAGSIILQAGELRTAHPACNLMVHFGTEYSESGTEARVNTALTKAMKDILKERTGKSMRMVNKWLDADTHFLAVDALKAGLIDEILEEA